MEALDDRCIRCLDRTPLEGEKYCRKCLGTLFRRKKRRLKRMCHKRRFAHQIQQDLQLVLNEIRLALPNIVLHGPQLPPNNNNQPQAQVNNNNQPQAQVNNDGNEEQVQVENMDQH